MSCEEDECAYSVRLLPDGGSFAAVSEITMWVDYFAEGATPKGTAIYRSEGNHADRTYACLRTGCYTMRFRFAENSTGLAFAVETSEGSLVHDIDDAVAGDLQRYYFCAETDACRVDVFPTFSPTASPIPTANPTPAPSSAPTPSPTGAPSSAPTASPSATPSSQPTPAPSATPSTAPSPAPSSPPSPAPVPSPTILPTPFPSLACAADECLSALQLDAAAFADVEISAYAGVLESIPEDEALYYSAAGDHRNVDYTCLAQTGCTTLFFVVPDGPGGLGFDFSTSEGEFSTELIDPDGDGVARFVFCLEECVLDRYPTFSPTISALPTPVPSPAPTSSPTASPSAAPTASPSASPTASPSAAPAPAPSPLPTAVPLPAPSPLPTTATPTATPTSADCLEGAVDLDFGTYDEEDARYVSVGVDPATGRPFDVLVLGLEDAEGGVAGQLGSIEVRKGATLDLVFAFVDSQNGDAVTLDAFYVSVLDLDTFGNAREAICVDDFEALVVSESDDLQIVEQTLRCDGVTAGASTLVLGVGNGFGCDDPEAAYGLETVTCEDCYGGSCSASQAADFPIVQRDRVAMVAFNAPRSAFSLQLTVTCPLCDEDELLEKRPFLFAGESALSTCPTFPPSAAPSAPSAKPSQAPTTAAPSPKPTTAAPSPKPTTLAPTTLAPTTSKPSFGPTPAPSPDCDACLSTLAFLPSDDPAAWASVRTSVYAADDVGGAALAVVEGEAPERAYACLAPAACYAVIFDFLDETAAFDSDVALLIETSEDVAFSRLGDVDPSASSLAYNFCLEDETCAFAREPTPSPSSSPAPSPSPTFAPSSSAAPTTAPTEYWDVCSGSDFDLQIEGSVILSNNLGGLGPNFDDPEELRYAAVTQFDGRDVDLVVAIQEGKEAHYSVADNYAQYQGTWEMFGQINVRDNSTAFLQFQFVDSVTGDAVVLNKFYVTIFDIDENRKDNRHKEALCVDADQFDAYVVPESTHLAIEDQAVACDGSPGASTIFRSTEPGFECDNPTDPSAPPRLFHVLFLPWKPVRPSQERPGHRVLQRLRPVRRERGFPGVLPRRSERKSCHVRFPGPAIVL